MLFKAYFEYSQSMEQSQNEMDKEAGKLDNNNNGGAGLGMIGEELEDMM